MITSVRLQNWTSFGEAQTAPLEPITVLVGANNSGKSNFLRSFHSFDLLDASKLHRPAPTPAIAQRVISMLRERRRLVWDLTGRFDAIPELVGSQEELREGSTSLLHQAWVPNSNGSRLVVNGVQRGELNRPSFLIQMDALQRKWLGGALADELTAVANARLVHLSADAIRAENKLSLTGTVESDGSKMAALVARWALGDRARLDQFNDILRRCLPEMKGIHAPPSSNDGNVRLVFEQTDGERFDAAVVSDGVVLFAALIAHALEAPEDGLVLIEEPERGLHPRRLDELLDVLRTLVETRRTQFILATHSASLLTLLRDEPESILLFRRTRSGTEIRQLSEVPELVENLHRADPGELFASGAFNEGFRGEGPNEAAQ